MHRIVSIRKFLTAVGCLVLVLGGSSPEVRAAITPVGNVLPADNPLTDLINEGLPPNGNFPDSSEPAAAQTHYESNSVVAGYTTQNAGIVVGQTSFGRLDIDGNSQLRYQTLIIGDTGQLGGQTRFGNGRVSITGLDALFNNDPNVNYPGLPPDFSSTAATKRAVDVGFDLYVGAAGVGTLDIHGGGRAEIQDAVIVGDLAGSNGYILVDGINSYLGSGGFQTTAGPGDTDPHAMFIGHLGIGEMMISNGGQVFAEAVEATVGQDVVGAVIGGEMFQGTLQPETGGVGIVTVTGTGSKWTVRGTLQIGSFHDPNGPGGPNTESEGDNVLYDSTVGRGTLNVYDGAIVNLIPIPDSVLLVDQDLAIGRFGRVNLDGGYISVGSPGVREDNVRLINDGVITGSGRIDTGRFRNRYLGEIRVGAGQKLLFDSSSEFQQPATDLEPLLNFGTIELIGTSDARAEIEFERAPNTPLDPVRPFINRTISNNVSGAFDGGQISGQYSTMRFRSGIHNEGSMLFTKGMNIVSGRVDNITGPNRNGLVFIGPNTTLVSEDDFASGGATADAPPGFLPIVSVAAGGTLIVENTKSLTLAGLLELELSLTNPSKIQVAGDLGINATLIPTFDSDAMSSLSHGDVFELMSFSGDIGGVDFADPVELVPDLAANPVLNVATDAAFNLRFPTLDLIAMPILNAYYLFVLDPSLVGPPGGPGAMGADFNGDGIVNGDDLAIWQMNVGISIGASVLQGDADGDGDVDGDDFLYWQSHVGLPNGSGAGSIFGATNVPEPTSVALLALGAMLALGSRRRAARWCYHH